MESQVPLYVLLGAIGSAKEDRLRSLLAQLCRKDDQNRQILAQLFQEAAKQTDQSASTETKASGSTSAVKLEARVSISKVKSEPKLSKSESSDGAATVSGQKHKQEDHGGIRYQICELCEEEFDVTMNYKEHCRYHPGISLLDTSSAYWMQDDPDMTLFCALDWLGEFPNRPHSIAHAIGRKEHSMGYIWDCCRRHGGDSVIGCQLRKHGAKAL